jgi:O-antigen/teichoic acid export membrane protein
MKQSPSEKAAFFRASGWLVTATTLGGGFMFLVQVVAIRWLNDADYGLMGTLFQALNLSMIPALGLQTVFAQQAAAAQSGPQRTLLHITARNVLTATAILWGMAALLLLITQNNLAAHLKSDRLLPLWLTLSAALPQLWLPVWMGILQGQQKFFWLGNALVFNGFGRFLAVCVFLGAMRSGVEGAVGAALIGFSGSLILCWIKADSPERGGSERVEFRWGVWLKQLLPLMLGLGSSTFFLGYDMIVVRVHFADEALTGHYAMAGLFGRGLVIFTIPIAQVMFPKVVRLAGSRQGSGRVLLHSLAATAALAVFGSLAVTGLCLLASAWLDGQVALNIAALTAIRDSLGEAAEEKIRNVVTMGPWFMWCMTPLCIANVLINHLMAVRAYQYFWMLVSVAVAYGFFLAVATPASPVAVIQVIGVFSLLLAGVSAMAVVRSSNVRQH